ncbi:MAG: macrolide ABC transporter ATP-binding protein, partial [Bacteroidetes bacterium RIFCSPHIGHO2_02_FULL_44_7]
LDKPTSGKILINNRDVSKMSSSELASVRGKKIGFVFQTFNLIPRLTALENIILPMWFADRNTDKKRAENLLKQVGLSHRIDNKPNQLSGGERQRVAIARALANEPEIIVADEPTGNLDSKTGEEIMKILSEIHKSGRTVVIVTHDLKISNMSERKVEMKDGMIIKETIR